MSCGSATTSSEDIVVQFPVPYPLEPAIWLRAVTRSARVFVQIYAWTNREASMWLANRVTGYVAVVRVWQENHIEVFIQNGDI